MNKKLISKFSLLLFSLALILLPASRVCFSLPEPGEVVFGDVTFLYPNSSTLEISASDKAIVNYNSFNINDNESVIVNMPSSNSEFLNRVTGNTASQLLGSLTSNGVFILVNPNGIVFGANAKVDVGGLVASTRDITNSDFLASKFVFNKLSKDQLDTLLINKGNITIRQGGFGVFIAGAIENEGVITANLGTIAMAAGDMITLNLSGNELISVAIDKATASKVYDLDGNPVTDQIKNTGTLKADGGIVLLKAESASDIFRNAINLQGYVSAVKAENQDGIIIMLTQRDIVIDATLFATEIQIGEADEAIPRNVTFQGSAITADKTATTLADNNVTVAADITANTGDIRLFADYDGDGNGEFSQLAGTIEAKSSGDVYIDGSGTMTLGKIKTGEGAIKIGTQREPNTITGNPYYVHTSGDIEITNTERQADTLILETTRDDLLRYNSQGSLTLEAQSGKILDLTDTYLPGNYLNLIAQGFLVNSSSLTTEIYKNIGDLEIRNVQSLDNLVTLEGEDVKVTYLKANNLTLRSDGAVNTSAGVIITANQVRVIAKQFGSIEVPLTIAAGLTYINRIQGDIEIMQSLGIGSTIMLRGPPEGFGAITYNLDTQLTLETENVIFNGNFTLFNDLVIEGNLKVVSGEIRGNGTKGSPVITVKKDLIFTGSGYTYFGYRDLLGEGDYRFTVNLEGNLTLDNPNAWVYSDINFTGSNDQAISYTQGTIYGSLKVNKPSGALNYGELNLTQLPLYFVTNQGQIPSAEVKFYIYLGNSLVYFTPEYVLYSFTQLDAAGSLQRQNIWLNFNNANPDTYIGPEFTTSAIFNYFKGSDPSLWQSNISTYYKIIYNELYPGINLIYSSKEGQLETEFLILAGADYQNIQLSYTGIEALEIDAQGNLIIKTSFGQLLEAKPYAYQNIAGLTQEITAEYTLLSNNSYGYKVTGYNPQYPLIIDPTLAYSTFIGGSDDDKGRSIAVDSSGNVYVAGYTLDAATDFPTTAGAYDTTHNGSYDVFVTKLNATGTSLTYSTFLGGSGVDVGFGIAVDSSGNAYVVGYTPDAVTDFPTTAGAYDTTHNGGSNDVFVAKLSSDGTSLTWSTFLGGSGDDVGRALAIDSSGNVYVTGETADAATDFPTTAGAYDTTHNGSYDVFVAKLSSDGSSLTYSTFLGGSGNEAGYGIAVDSSGNVYVTGYTTDAATDFPTTAGVYDTTHNGLDDVFVAKLNSDGTSLTYSTFLGGSDNDVGRSIVIDSSGNVYVTGETADAATDFPTTAGAYDTTQNGNLDAFVAKLNSDATSLTYSTFLGGSDNERGYGIAVDSSGNVYVTGYTTDAATDFPTTAGAYDTTHNGLDDVFVAKLNSDGTSLTYSTFLGGSGTDQGYAIAIDSSGNAYVTGEAGSGFPTTSSAYDTTQNGNFDAFVAKIAFSYTWDGSSSTDWATAANWDVGAVPESIDSVVIDDVTNDPLLDSARTVNNLTINAAGILDLNGKNLTLSGTFTNNGTLKLAGSETLTTFTNDTDTGTVQYAGTGSYSSLAAGNTYYHLTFSNTGTYSLNAALTVNGNLTISNANGTLNLNSNNLTLASGSVFSNTGTLQLAGSETLTNFTNDTDSGTVQYSGTSVYASLKAGNTYYHLTFSSTGNYSLNAALTVNGNLTISNASGILNLNSNNLTLASGSVFSNTGTLKLTGAETLTNFTNDTDSGTIYYTGDSSYTGLNTGNTHYNLTFSEAGTYTLNANLDVNNTLTNISSTLAFSTYSVTVGGTFDNGATFTSSGTVTLDATSAGKTITSGGSSFNNLTFNGTGGGWTLQDALDVNGDLTITAGTLVDDGYSVNIGGNLSNSATFTTSGTVTFDSTSTGKTITSGGVSFNNLTFNGSGGGWTLQDALDVNNNLTISAGTLAAGANAITIGNNFSNSGTFTAGTGTVTFDSTSTGKTITSGSASFYNLTFNGVGGGWTLQDALDVDNNFTITNGTLDANAKAMTIAGNWSNSGTFTHGNNTVTFDGTSTQTLNSGGSSFYGLTISNTSSGGVQLSTNNLTVSNALSISSNALLDLAGKNLTVTGASFSNTGTLKLAGSETLTNFTNDTDSGTLEYTGTATYASLAAGNNYYNLTISGSGSFTAASALDVNNNFAQSAGTFIAPSSMNIAGNFNKTGGTFTPGSNTVTFDSTSTGKTITSGSASFYNLTFNGAGGGWTLQDALDVDNNFTITNGTLDANAKAMTIAGNWSNSGTFTHGNNTVTFDGSGTSTISNSNTFYNFSSTTAGKQLTFTAGTTQTITATLTLTGSSGNLIKLRSTVDSTQWKIDPQGTRSISYVDVEYSNNIHATRIDPTNATDSGSNSNWFAPASTSLTQTETERATKATETIPIDITIIILILQEQTPTSISEGGVSPASEQAQAEPTAQAETTTEEETTKEEVTPTGGFDERVSYEDGEKRYGKPYVPGKYRTVVILFEGKVITAPYDEKGIKENETVVLLPGDKISREGLVKAGSVPQARYRVTVIVFEGDPLKIMSYDKGQIKEDKAVFLNPGEKLVQVAEVK